MAQKQVLGKGLASLLPGAAMVQPPQVPAGAVAAGEAVPVAHQAVAQPEQGARIPGISMALLDEITVNQYQPRRDFDDATLEELAQSIRANGIIQPLVVRRLERGYMLIAGERRMRAAKLAGLKQVPVVIRRSTDREALELALIENIQRENLNCVDEAMAYFQLMQDFSLTQEEVASRVGKERATVANYLRLLRLPEAVIDDLKRGILSFGHGKALLSVEDTELRLRARKEIIERKLSVRESEALIDELKRKAEPQSSSENTTEALAAATPVASRLYSIAQDLTRKWGSRVEMKGNEKRGKIVVHYTSRQELERLLGTLQN